MHPALEVNCYCAVRSQVSVGSPSCLWSPKGLSSCAHNPCLCRACQAREPAAAPTGAQARGPTRASRGSLTNCGRHPVIETVVCEAGEQARFAHPAVAQ